METPIYPLRVARSVFARDSERVFLPLLIIGAALVLAGIASQYAIGRVMSPTGATMILGLLSGSGALLFLAGLFLTWFYRDPDRKPRGGLVSPADGKVIIIDQQDDKHVGRALRIAIFMSPIDVHVNRVPTSARLLGIHHSPGGYLPAFKKESERNERLTTNWHATGEDDDGLPVGTPFTLVQIAGTLARRIVPWKKTGQTLARGERYGMIKFGSRVDLYLPPDVEPCVKIGQRVKAGETMMAKAVGQATKSPPSLEDEVVPQTV
jgi:phosphatidylserine decarboxylase